MAGFGAVGKSAMRLSYLIANADGTIDESVEADQEIGTEMD